MIIGRRWPSAELVVQPHVEVGDVDEHLGLARHPVQQVEHRVALGRLVAGREVHEVVRAAVQGRRIEVDVEQAPGARRGGSSRPSQTPGAASTPARSYRRRPGRPPSSSRRRRARPRDEAPGTASTAHLRCPDARGAPCGPARGSDSEASPAPRPPRPADIALGLEHAQHGERERQSSLVDEVSGAPGGGELLVEGHQALHLEAAAEQLDGRCRAPAAGRVRRRAAVRTRWPSPA